MKPAPLDTVAEAHAILQARLNRIAALRETIQARRARLPTMVRIIADVTLAAVARVCRADYRTIDTILDLQERHLTQLSALIARTGAHHT